MLTRYEPIAELKTIMLFLLGETEILFPLAAHIQPDSY